MTKIEKLGLQEKIIKDKEEGLSEREIARKYNLSRGAIEHFLKNKYIPREIQKPLTEKSEKRIEITTNSIFNINTKLEETHSILLGLRSEFENFREVFKKLAKDGYEDDFTKFKWFKEYREQVKLSGRLIEVIDKQIVIAVDLIKNLTAYEEAKKFRQYLLEEIGKESEDVKQRIIRKLHNARSIIQ